ncbi:polyprenol monophosphomannose synthase [Chlorobaculum thiosulfatiphilum]|uniref:polyprenol monophosphomannose synthase n=1 Tax=Chlorobaculum thiosulfatiphilum TaxID=115852 RepID=UPI001FE75D71|nr:polyprenol monophosphomannose synthase [Chlorobaculum thiosulfatiphilum]
MQDQIVQKKEREPVTAKTLIIIPTYNEADNIRPLIESIIERYPASFDILVIDDNSPDGTSGIVRRIMEKETRITLLTRPTKLGLGTAYLMGFRYALDRGYERVIEMDADFSHDPASIASLTEAMKGADMVIGSRYMNNTVNVVNWPLSRLILSKSASIYTRWITGMPVSDPTSGFKCISAKALSAIALDRVHSQGYSFQIEIDFRVWKKGLVIHEVPIIFVDRSVGKSKMTRKNIVEAVWMVWWLKLLSIAGRL